MRMKQQLKIRPQIWLLVIDPNPPSAAASKDAESSFPVASTAFVYASAYDSVDAPVLASSFDEADD